MHHDIWRASTIWFTKWHNRCLCLKFEPLEDRTVTVTVTALPSEALNFKHKFLTRAYLVCSYAAITLKQKVWNHVVIFICLYSWFQHYTDLSVKIPAQPELIIMWTQSNSLFETWNPDTLGKVSVPLQMGELQWTLRVWILLCMTLHRYNLSVSRMLSDNTIYLWSMVTIHWSLIHEQYHRNASHTLDPPSIIIKFVLGLHLTLHIY